ncbi:MAG TPA: contractile injection system tape measure protein [Flavipsychrobacter sp.]|nr:contractile injection system tape measure protein [Flavipsychrobacter sp.]
MITKEKNIIRKQVFELQYNGKANGIAIRKKAEELLKEYLLPRMEVLFNKYAGTNRVLDIDTLNVEISIDKNDWDYKLLDRVIDSIETEIIKKINTTQSAATTNIRQKFIELLVFYFSNGYLPWWSAINNNSEWKEQLKSFFSEHHSREDLQKLQTLLQEYSVRTRIITNLGEEDFWLFVETLQGEKSSFINNWKKDYTILTTALSNRERRIISSKYKHALLNAIASQTESDNATNNLFVELFSEETEAIPMNFISNISASINNTILKKALDRSIQSKAEKLDKIKAATDNQNKTSPKPEEEKEGIYIQNAGLVLVAPYLSMLFKKLGLVQDNQITDIARAIALMNYIVSGNEEYEEFETALNKILAGVGIETPLAAKHILTQDEKNEVTELLQAVIGYWEILKNTSVEGLRISFLQREGKLFFENESWNLQVQQQSYDMLLQHLPWNINMIKLPWMKHLLNVNWIQGSGII